ncbi:hypothetical protein E4U42_005856 [Claviceps africana]|uniref:ERCC4 domain-containing protein n=1 Tax=Claviceps africana TaxID=83212 RepID=A0A8K0J977_9HYPO|nr:hypothetical protein E4U42_005856 [Claviceps africana]
MAPDVIDLISSSPRLSHGTSPLSTQNAASFVSAGASFHRVIETQSPSTEGVVHTSTHKWSSTSTRTKGKGSLLDEIDDDIFDLLDIPQPKRRRVLRPDAGHKEVLDLPRLASNSNQEHSHPPLMSHNRPLSKRTVLEPIEFTSSLEQTTPKRDISLAAKTKLSPSSKHSEPANVVSILENDDPFLSDPFASPEPLAPGKQSARRAMSCDPFLSSSPPRASTAHDRSNGTKSYRSGLSKRSDAIAHEGEKLDPFADDPSHKQRAADSTLGDLICIDDSSEKSHESSDEELPSIMEMDLTKRRARSPIRRTQSDTTFSNRTAPRSTRAEKHTRPKKTAAERETEKENKRREREQLKAAKAVEKERVAALAEVNKLRTDKKISTPEMIVDLASGLNTGLQVQIKEMLQGLGVEHATWSCPCHNMIRWRRKVTSRFNEDMGLWEPIPPRISHEEIALVIFVAEEFVSLAVEEGLDKRIAEIKRQYGRKKLVLLLQGMTAWTRKNRSIRNRKFTSGVRAAGDETAAAGASSSSSTTSRARAVAEYISEDIIEDAMLSLHVEHGVLIHHTAVPLETAKWVINFTQHISTIPYKRQRDQATSVAGFCMESGQVRTGDGVQDTYVRMLQEIVRITAPIAYGVAAEFDSVTKLVKGLEGGGPERLAAVRKSTNKDGAMSDRTVGQAVSRRVYKVFTGTDEDSTDV